MVLSSVNICNPVLWRFMQGDVYQGDGLNLYAYCGNNPVVYYDPTGYECGDTGEIDDGLGADDAGDAGDAKVHTPNSNTTFNMEPEKKAPNAIHSADAMDKWDNFWGLETTKINPRTGLPDPDRIFSADGTRSIRFSPHEMNSIGTTVFNSVLFSVPQIVLIIFLILSTITMSSCY